MDASSFALVDPQRGRVEPLEEEVGKQRLRTVRGVRILLAAERGVTPAYARRVTACRLQKSPGAMPTGQDIVVNAREIADGLEITVTSEDPAVARAIVEAHKS